MVEKGKKEEEKVKGMRNANIRISKNNNTKDGLKVYEFEDIISVLESWSSEKEIEYFAIEHKEDLENIHYHIVIRFKSITRFDTIKNKFNYGDIQNSKSVKNSIQYLVHMNSPEKVRYDWEDIKTNSTELNKYMLKSKVSEELDINYYVNEIVEGRIKEFEYTDKIPALIYTKNSTRIDKAFKFYYDKLSVDSNREIEVEFYFGKGGTGKTVFAKTMCEYHNESYCVSSSSNDPLQDYKGQETLILDDLRDDVFKFDDLLKILDNNTKSSMNSRYRNKMFIGNRIIITSNIELYEWYKELKKEDIHQFHRRINIMCKFNNTTVDMYIYDKEVKKYEFLKSVENFANIIVKEEIESRREKVMNRFNMMKGV